jgi:hypothetical protein
MKYSGQKCASAVSITQVKIYCCKLGSNKLDWGSCFIRSNSTTDPNGKSLSVAYQISTSPDCTCKEYKQKQRGLPKAIVRNIQNLIETAPRIKPAQAKMAVFQEQMNQSNTKSNHKQGEVTGKQVKQAFGYQRQKAKEDRTIANNITQVYHLVGLRKKHAFKLPDHPSANIRSEEDVQRMATELYDDHKLKVFATEGIDFVRANVYCMMTVLDPTPDDTDIGTTERERENYISI